MTQQKQPPTKRGKTEVAQDGETAPKLPHERDQSSDSQQNPDGRAPEVGAAGVEGHRARHRRHRPRTGDGPRL